jgi:imidazolonepropionase
LSKNLHITNASEICIPELEGNGIERHANFEMVILDGQVHWIGPSGTAPADAADCDNYDAMGGAVLPALVDFHTHLVYAGDRVDDFARRSEGCSYAEIAAGGGGILTTVEATRAASVEQLTLDLGKRLKARQAYGIATTEIKSGYGLSIEHELAMLQAADAMRKQGWDIESTLLAAHTVPTDIAREEYLRQIQEVLIPRVAKQGLARFVDVFIEKSAYTIAEAKEVYRVAKAHGLIPRVHADQITAGGGAELAAEVGASSADHLEQISNEGIVAMRDARVIAGLLPGAAVFLGDDVRGLGKRFVDAGVEVAVATDANPGSSPLYNSPLAATLATTLMGLSADQAIRGVTQGAANALKRKDIGNLRPGYKGRFIVLDHCDSRALVYAYGEPIVKDLQCCDQN